MKTLIILLFLSPIICIGQKHHDYVEHEDTIFLNGRVLIPGDTVRLGIGSGPDKDFYFIWQQSKKLGNGVLGRQTEKHLSSNSNNTFLIYKGRAPMENIFKPDTQLLFYLLGEQKRVCRVSLFGAIERGEIKGFDK